MKELSLNILDIAKNSVKAKATLIEILLEETAEVLTLTIRDDGCGMTPEVLAGVTDPFYTTRTTRRVGLGLPLLKLAAEQTGGEVSITSRHESLHPEDHGTEVVANFYKNHIDFTPMGDVVSSIVTLIQGNPDTDFLFRHEMGTKTAMLDTREVRQVLGGDVPLDSFEVLAWIQEYLNEQY
jgi:hypothetical protein